MSTVNGQEFMGAVEALSEQLEIAQAHVALLYTQLALLVEYVQRVGGFMFTEDQKTLREAMAALDEVAKP